MAKELGSARPVPHPSPPLSHPSPFAATHDFEFHSRVSAPGRAGGLFVTGGPRSSSRIRRAARSALGPTAD